MTKREIYRKMYATFVDVTKLKKGDKVKITRSFTEYQDGCDLDWNSKMIDFVGKTGEVMGVQDKITVLFLSCERVWCFPYFCVDIVEEIFPEPIYLNEGSDYKAEFKQGGEVVVGCQSICFNVLESIYETAKKIKDKN